MIPNNENSINVEELEISQYIDNDFKLDTENNIIAGKVKGIDKLRQDILLVLNIERYNYIIYDWNIGIETQDLYGMPVEYVCSELEYRIIDALSVLDAIEEINNFEFDTTSKKRVVICSFTIKTKYGDYNYEKEVEY